MAFRIGRTIKRGVNRARTSTGLVVFLFFFVVESLMGWGIDPRHVNQQMLHFGLFGMTRLATMAVITIIASGLSLVVTIWACRLLVDDHETLDTFEVGELRGRLLKAVGSLFAVQILLGGGVAVAMVGIQLLAALSAILALIGLVFLVPVLIYAVLTFVFVPFAVAVDNRGPIGALRRSAEITSGHRRSLLGLFVLYILTMIPLSLIDNPSWMNVIDMTIVEIVYEEILFLVLPLIATFSWAALSTVVLAVLAEIYTQVTGDANWSPQ